MCPFELNIVSRYHPKTNETKDQPLNPLLPFLRCKTRTRLSYGLRHVFDCPCPALKSGNDDRRQRTKTKVSLK